MSIQSLDISWLRNNVTLLQQQSVLFNETIFRNIAFGRRDYLTVPIKDVDMCIETACLETTVAALPQGINTVVGAGGCALSGGQKQRLAIARARLRNTPILIIDEGTSALDHITRIRVMDAIRSWRGRKTTIIITHDISQIQDTDFAYVMDKGAVVQEGFRPALEQKLSNKAWELLQPNTSKAYLSRLRSSFALGYTGRFNAIGESSRSSRDDLNSMDIQVQPKPTLIPRIAKLLEEGYAPSSSSDRRASFASAAMVSARRLSMGASSFNLPRSRLSYLPYLDQEQSWPLVDTRIQLNSSEMFSPISLESTSRTLLDVDGKTGSISRSCLPKFSRITKRSDTDLQFSSLKSLLITIWPTLLWKDRLSLITGFAFATVHAAATPLFSWVFSKLLGTFFLPDNRTHMAFVWSMSVLGVAIGDSISVFLMHYLLERCGQAWIDTVRVQAIKRILDQPRAWFDEEENNHSSLIECLDRNAEEMRNLLGRFAAFVYLAIVMLLIAIIWSMILCWKLTLVGLASAPFVYAVTRLFEGVSGHWERISNDAGGKAGSVFTETFENIKTVRSLTLEAYFHQKYSGATDRAKKVGYFRSGYSGLLFGISDSAVIFLTALIFFYGAKLVSSLDFSTLHIVTVLTMLLFSVTNANNAIAFLPQISTSRDTASRLLRLTILPYESSHEHIGRTHLRDVGSISFSKVSFSYPSRPDVLVLNDIDLKLATSRSTALVGSSGCGKSTLASLILGLYSPSSGTLMISNYHLGSLHLPTVRSLVAIVSQQPAIFPASIKENIIYGLPEYSRLSSMASVRIAAKAAEIDDFISSLPDGYDTLIGEGGSGLSGGQAQRVAIARALVRRPKMLLLDEATSGLDGESALAIRNMIQRLARQGIGVVAITHDEEMMKICDSCVVLQEGQVAEQGLYADLIWKRGGELRRLLGSDEG